MCPVVECDDSCCNCALLPPTFWVVWGGCAAGILSHVFNGLGSLSNLDFTTPMGNTEYIWHH